MVEHNAKLHAFWFFCCLVLAHVPYSLRSFCFSLVHFWESDLFFSKLQAFAAGHFLNHVMPSREMILQQDTPAVYAGEAPPHRATNWFLFQYMSSSEFQQGFRRAEVSSMAWHFTCSNLPAHVLALSMDHRWAGCT